MRNLEDVLKDLKEAEKEYKEMGDWLQEQREAGKITEEFTIDIRYSFYGGAGSKVYICVFKNNIF